MKKPLVTIGIPFYNPGDLIKVAIRSVFAQTLDNWELILIDDGSTDRSEELVRMIKSEKVRVLCDRNNLGLPARLNQIASEAKGKYLARMDADDIMHPKRLEKQVIYLEQHPDIDLLGTRSWILDEFGRVRGKANNISTELKIIEVLKRGGIIHPTLMASREWFLKNPYISCYPRAEDRELILRVLRRYRIICMPENLFYYRFNRRINLYNFIQGYSSERKLLIKYGRQYISNFMTLRLYLRSCLKSFNLPLMVWLNKGERLIKRNYSDVTEQEQKTAENIIKRIKEYNVPGWQDM